MRSKHLYLLFVVSLFLISCETDQLDRSPTRLGLAIAPADTAAIYKDPPCRASLEKYHMKSSTLNFNTVFDFTSKVRIDRLSDRIQITLTNQNNDVLEFEFRTFIREQSTIYNIVPDLTNKKYDCTLKGKVNAFPLSTKLPLEPIPNQSLYVKFIGNDNYEFALCDSDFKYSFNGNQYTTDINFLINMAY